MQALAPELQYATWDFDPEVLVTGLVAAMETPLGPEATDPRLRDLDARRVFDELTFELPVRTSGGVVSLRDIGNVMLEHLPGDDRIGCMRRGCGSCGRPGSAGI